MARAVPVEERRDPLVSVVMKWLLLLLLWLMAVVVAVDMLDLLLLLFVE